MSRFRTVCREKNTFVQYSPLLYWLGVKAIKTYIRTKSGRLVERVIFMNDEDYAAFLASGGDGDLAEQLLKKYLSKVLWFWVWIDFCFTPTEFDVYRFISYLAVLFDCSLQDEAKGLESWDKEEQKAITTYIRTKSGRRVAKTVYVSKRDYEAIKRGEADPNKILQKYVNTEDGEKLDGKTQVIFIFRVISLAPWPVANYS